MAFLPIVERELRVAARKRSTIWFRVLAALIGILIGSAFLGMSSVFGGGGAGLGRSLFGTLTWLSLAAALAAGLFLTADSLSEEKREGTLGFLFLTDLRGYDVVGGKLLATSLRSSYALLALFPVLAVTLIMGGVTGIQFWKSALALVNALFCSLAAGLLVSSISRDSQRALGGTVLLLLIVCIGCVVGDIIIASLRGTGFKACLSLASPAYVFWAATAWGKTSYWEGLLASHLLAWSGLAIASLLVPRTWQDRVHRSAAPSSVMRGYSWKYGGPMARAAQRSKLLYPNPVLWLALRRRWQFLSIWVLLLLVLVALMASALVWSSVAWMLWAQASSLVLVVLYLWAASEASRFFVDARRSGLMELLLVTPLTNREVVLGQWHALLRMFGLPAVFLLMVQLTGVILSQLSPMNSMVPAGAAYSPSLALSLFTGAIGALCTMGNLVALMWFGMWMGLISKNASLATLKTVVFVQVLPWLGISFGAGLIVLGLMLPRLFGSGPASGSITFPFVMSGLNGLLILAKDIAFFAWSRNRLLSTFRAEAARLPVSSTKRAQDSVLAAA
jgi:hypothetical protein